MKRRNILIGFGAVAAAAAAGGAYWLNRAPAPAPMASAAGGAAGTPPLAAAGGDMPLYEDDHILGDAAAPVTILEYSSLTCPHCANFHANTLPDVKANWIDSGRARLVYRHYPLDQLALRAAALTECIQGEGFFGFLDVLFLNQSRWSHSDDPATALQQYAALAGLSAADFQVCISDEAAIDRILRRQSEGRDKYKVASTPSFVVNGTSVVGGRTYEDFNAILETAAAKATS
jgi:protein-disulfide isomerase